MNSPRHNASASQHISTTTANNRKPTTPTATNNNTATTTTTINNKLGIPRVSEEQQQHQPQLQQQQQRQQATPSNNSNNCSIKLRPRTHPLPHRCPRLRTKKVTGSSNNSCNKKERHMASNSMETPSQRQVAKVPQSPAFLSRAAKRTRVTPKPRWSFNNIDSSCKVILSCVGFLRFFSVLFFECFLECIAEVRNKSQSNRARTISSHFSMGAHRTSASPANTASLTPTACTIDAWSLQLLEL